MSKLVSKSLDLRGTESLIIETCYCEGLMHCCQSETALSLCRCILQIRQTNTEVNQLVEKRMMSGDPLDDKLSMFRQQVLKFQLLDRSQRRHMKDTT